MYCGKCGSIIEAGDVFCGSCGASVAERSVIQQSPSYSNQAAGVGQYGYTQQSTIGRTIIKRSNAKSSTLVTGWIGVVLCFIMCFVMFSFYKEPRNLAEILNMRNYSYSALNDLKGMFLFYSLLLFFVSMTQMLKMLAVAKSFVCVCEEGVYGVAGKSFYFSTQPFEVRYDQITNAGKGNPIIGNVRIDCGPNTYGCLISDPTEIIELIRSKQKQLQQH